MIYYCADDYGLNDISSTRIQQCINEGVLNKVSVFPNFAEVDSHNMLKDKNVRVSLHLNLVEGKCMAESNEIDLLADKNGNLKHTFGGLFKLSLFQKKEFEKQVYREIKAQIVFWKGILPQGVSFCVDSHQHTHMIPAVFKSLLQVLQDEKINLEYMRIPAEPLLPYIKTPSLYFTYSAVNIVKQWLLKVLWLIDKKWAKKYKIPTAYFFGILFSGKMDEERINKVLPKYMKMAKKDNKDIEVLFHPGYLDKSECDLENKNIVFDKFYFSKNRKIEFDSVMKMAKRSV